MYDKKKEDDDMAITESRLKSKLQDLRSKALKRRYSGEYRTELNADQKRILEENHKDLEYEQYKAIDTTED
ncbi:hypothetical protein ACH97_200025 [Bacillus paralicheniformis]|nr:hypothetical protein ACH97_200025 [Bacillus paralicheniformis]